MPFPPPRDLPDPGSTRISFRAGRFVTMELPGKPKSVGSLTIMSLFTTAAYHSVLSLNRTRPHVSAPGAPHGTCTEAAHTRPQVPIAGTPLGGGSLCWSPGHLGCLHVHLSKPPSWPWLPSWAQKRPQRWPRPPGVPAGHSHVPATPSACS